MANQAKERDGGRTEGGDVVNAPEKALWIKRRARVSRFCQGLDRADSCGRPIGVGATFWQYKFRSGLDHAELCVECGAKVSA